MFFGLAPKSFPGPGTGVRFSLCRVQEALRDFSGTVLAVSHDRYFLRQIVNRVVEVKDHKLQDYSGDYNVSGSCGSLTS